MKHILIIPSDNYLPDETILEGIFQRHQAEALVRAGFKVGLISPIVRSLRLLPSDFRRWGIRRAEENGVTVYRGFYWYRPRPDYENCRRRWISVGCKLFRAYVRSCGRPDVIHAHNASFAGMLAAKLSKEEGLPCVLTVHSTSYRRGLIQPMEIPHLRTAYAGAAARLVVSPSLGADIEKVIGPAASGWEWVPNVLSQDFEAPLPGDAPPHHDEGFRFLNVATLDEKKGHADLLRAFASAFPDRKDVVLRIGGAGPLGPDLERQAGKLGIGDRVTFAGLLSHEKVRKEMLACDAFVLPSHVETFGVVVIEALSCGKPVVATRCGGPEWFIGPDDGELVPVGDIGAMAKAMSRMVTRGSGYDPASIRSRCIEKFGWRALVANLSEIYDRVSVASGQRKKTNTREPVAPRPYQICTHCVMDTTDPDIYFDEAGVCNHCKMVEAYQKTEPYCLNPAEKEESCRRLVDKIKRKGARKKYDCVIGLSGGVDSSYVAYKVKEWGLRPLAVHLDNGWNSELSVKNIENICNKLKIDLFTHVIDWEEFKDIQLAFLRASTPDSEIPSDHAIVSILYQVAAREGVKFILGGTNMATESILPRAWSQGHTDWKYIKNIHKQFGKQRIRTFPHRSRLVMFWDQFIRRIQWISILDYVQYDKEFAKEIVRQNLEWRDYGSKHHESNYTKIYQAYILPTKFHYDKRRAHLSNLICAGLIDREAALKSLKEPLYSKETLEEDIHYMVNKFGLSRAEFDEIMALPRKVYEDYPNFRNSLFMRVGRRAKRYFRSLRIPGK